jgi:hypothetical protein
VFIELPSTFPPPNMSPRCRCAEFGIAVEALPTREAFVRGMTVQERDDSSWAELLECVTCGQLWRVDVGAEVDRRSNVAFRIPPGADWRTVDLRPGLRELAIRRAGGTAPDPCAWSGCSNSCLRGKRICVDHALGFVGRSS